jgi:pimeloyl-ACP methyl ester carboxylesterase
VQPAAIGTADGRNLHSFPDFIIDQKPGGHREHHQQRPQPRRRRLHRHQLILTDTGPKGGKDTHKISRITYNDILRATLTRSDPKEFLFFNRNPNPTGKRAAKAFVKRLRERTADRDDPFDFKAIQTQLKAIKRRGKGAPADLSGISQPTLIANGDNDRMVPSVLSEDLHRRITGSELIIYPGSGHGGIFRAHDSSLSPPSSSSPANWHPRATENMTLPRRHDAAHLTLR